VAGPGDLGPLAEAYENGDALTQRFVIRIMGSLEDQGASVWLMLLAATAREDFLDHQLLQEGVNRLQKLQRASVQPELVKQTTAHFGTRYPDSREFLTALQKAAAQEEGNYLPMVEALRAWAKGAFESFLLDALTLVGEGKLARYSALVSDTAQATEARLAHLGALVDQVAEALAFRVDCSLLDKEELLPVLTPLLLSRAGGDGFITAFLRHLPVTEQGLLDELLKDI